MAYYTNYNSMVAVLLGVGTATPEEQRYSRELVQQAKNEASRRQLL